MAEEATESTGTEEVAESSERQPTAPRNSVKVADASDADLDAILKQENPDEYLENWRKQQAKPVAPKPKQKEPPKDPKAEGNEGKQENKSAVEDTIVVSKERWEKQQKQLEQQEQFIKHRNNEVGDLKKQLAQQNEALAQKYRDLVDEDPLAAADVLEQIKSNNATVKDEETKQRQFENIHRNQQILHAALGPEGLDVDAMVEVLEADGVSGRAIVAFKANPYAANPETTLHLAKRARAQRQLNAVAKYAMKLRDRVAELEGQVKDAPQKVARNVERALRGSPPLTAKTNSTAGAKQRSTDPSKMTMAELDAYLAQAGG